MTSPKLLSRQDVLRALADPAFFRAIPEFASLQSKLKTMGVLDMGRRGCRSCKQRRVEQNVFRDFLTVLRTLDASALARVKAYLQADALMVTWRNPQTGAFEPAII